MANEDKLIKFVVGGRRSGKTTQLIKWAMEFIEGGPDRVIVTYNSQGVQEIRSRIREVYGVDLPEWRVITQQQLREGYLRGHTIGKIEVGLDEIEPSLTYGGYKVALIATTGRVHEDLGVGEGL